jgi:hypothetical protein
MVLGYSMVSSLSHSCVCVSGRECDSLWLCSGAESAMPTLTTQTHLQQESVAARKWCAKECSPALVCVWRTRKGAMRRALWTDACMASDCLCMPVPVSNGGGGWPETARSTDCMDRWAQRPSAVHVPRGPG